MAEILETKIMLANSVHSYTAELDNAKSLIEEGDFDEALRRGIDLLAFSVSDSDVWTLIGEALLGKAALSEANEAARLP